MSPQVDMTSLRVAGPSRSAYSVFAAALPGSRSADPTFGMLLEKTQSSTPTLPYANPYSIAQVALSLPRPLVVAVT
jgi:uncharacterized transporter YbjL